MAKPKTLLKYALRLVLILALIPVGTLVGLSIMSTPPDHLGVSEGRLAPCPAKPNCVSTQAEDELHAMEPIPLPNYEVDVIPLLKQVILDHPRTKIVTERDDYLHAEFTSLIFRFVDDVEFWFDRENQLIHFRSASRVGHSDLGVNRKRMERLRSEFEVSCLKEH